MAGSLAVLVGVAAAAAPGAVAGDPGVAPPSERAAPAATAHRVYLVKVLGRGSYTDPETGADNSRAVLPVLDTALQRWVDDSAGRITSFRRVPEIRTVTLSGACQSGSATWNQADDEVWPGVDFGSDSGNHLMVMQPRDCGGGVGTVGDSINDGGKITFAADLLENHTTFVHEIGHNLGLSHSHAQSCDADGCTDAAYGNTYTPMGSTPYGDVLPPVIDSFQRAQLEILAPCEVPVQALPAGQRAVATTYDLAGRATGGGTRGIRVLDPVTGQEHWIDWRHGAGRDARSTYVRSTARRPGITVTTRLDETTSQLQTVARDADGDSIYSLRTGESFTAPGLVVTAERAEPGEPWSRVQVLVGDSTRPAGPALPVLAGRRVALPAAAAAGSTLTARTPGWTGGTCHRYQWLDGGRPIPGALGATYTVPAGLGGHRISVRVTGQRVGYRPRTVTSTATTIGRFVRAPRPVVRGGVRVGAVLRARPRLDRWQPRPTRVRYAWYAGGRRVATGPTLRLRPRHLGARVTVVVTGTRPGYSARAVRSVPTPKVGPRR